MLVPISVVVKSKRIVFWHENDVGPTGPLTMGLVSHQSFFSLRENNSDVRAKRSGRTSVQVQQRPLRDYLLDRRRQSTHTTIYGKTPTDKVQAAALGKILATAAGANVDRKLQRDI